MSTFSRKRKGVNAKTPKLTNKELVKINARFDAKVAEYQEAYKDNGIEFIIQKEQDKISSTDKRALRFVIDSILSSQEKIV